MASSSTPFSAVEGTVRQKSGVPLVPVPHELKLEVRLVRIAVLQDMSRSGACGRAYCESRTMSLRARRRAVTEAAPDQSLSAMLQTTWLISSELCRKPGAELIRRPPRLAPPCYSAFVSKDIVILKQVQLRAGSSSIPRQAVARSFCPCRRCCRHRTASPSACPSGGCARPRDKRRRPRAPESARRR